jgi:hypothetical protein
MDEEEGKILRLRCDRLKFVGPLAISDFAAFAEIIVHSQYMEDSCGNAQMLLTSIGKQIIDQPSNKKQSHYGLNREQSETDNRLITTSPSCLLGKVFFCHPLSFVAGREPFTPLLSQ